MDPHSENPKALKAVTMFYTYLRGVMAVFKLIYGLSRSKAFNKHVSTFVYDTSVQFFN